MKSKAFRLILRLSAVAILAGCAHTIQTRQASELLLTTDKSTTVLFKQLNDKLSEHKYKITKEDAGAGLFVLAPRGFSFESDGRKVIARQTVQMRQEGGSLKLRIVYDCNYAGDKRTFAPCLLEDQDAVNKISRVERGFLESIRPLLLTHTDTVTGANTSAGTVEPARAPAATPAATPPTAPSTSQPPASFDDWGDAAH